MALRLLQPAGMESFLTQCSSLLVADLPLLISVALAGLVGSLTHCSVMCSPLVAAQMLQLKEKQKPQSFMLYYYAGKLSSYMALGVLSVLMSRWLFSGEAHYYTNGLLFTAGGLFIASALLPHKTHGCCSSKTQGLSYWIAQLSFAPLIYYLRGILMGFMPCGMIVAVLLSVATLSNPIHAAFIMLVFGLTTVPALQLVGHGALRLGQYYPSLSAKAGRGVMALNGLFLCGVGLNLVSVN